jgi:hypothetical protein
MRTVTRLLIFGSAIGAAVIAGRRRARRPLDEPDADLPAPDGVEDAPPGADDAALPVGISEVDPQPLTQISGEGIDPDATRAAHDEPRERRERLAIPGKNLP